MKNFTPSGANNQPNNEPATATRDPLGNKTILSHTADNHSTENDYYSSVLGRSRRMDLRSEAAELLPKERVAKCGCFMGLTGMVNLYRQDQTRDAYYTGLIQCGSVWVCPVCGAKAAEERRQELQAGLDAWHIAGFSTLHVTFTLQHHKGESCESVLDGLQDAYYRFWRGKPIERLFEPYGLAGRVSALEPLYGENGWHLHYHVLLFFKCPLDQLPIDEFEAVMKPYWCETLNRVGRYATLKNGLAIVKEHDKIADYLNKFGHLPNDEEALIRWTGANEVTKGHVKRGSKGASPVDLLIAYQSGDEKAGRLFVEFATAFKGKKQLRWTKGLQEMIEDLKPIEDPDPEEAEDPEEARLICQIPATVWLELVKRRLTGVLLEVAAIEGDSGVRQFMNKLGLVAYYPDLEMWEAMGLSPGQIGRVTVDSENWEVNIQVMEV